MAKKLILINFGNIKNCVHNIVALLNDIENDKSKILFELL